jgi:hypothetical protein
MMLSVWNLRKNWRWRGEEQGVQDQIDALPICKING